MFDFLRDNDYDLKQKELEELSSIAQVASL